MQLSNNKKKQLPLFIVLSLIILPLVLISVYLVIREFNHQTNVALERRGATANLAASLIHEKFDGIINLGTALASHAGFYQYIEKSNWGEAIKHIGGVEQAVPILDTIAILDTNGVLKATIPPMPEALGKSFAYRDYYQGVSKEWKPYVSEAFKRAAEPKYNVVAVAVPIKSPNQKVLGILLLTTKLDTVLSWTHELNVDSTGFAYVVDKKGQLVSHPYMNPSADLVDFSSVVTVQKLLRGERGVEVLFNSIDNEERVTAYTPVKDFGFGVAVVQPTRSAFAERNNQVITIAITYVLVITLTTFFVYWILKEREAMRIQRDRERAILESIGDGIVAIDRDWKIVLWNKAATAIAGWSEEEALGKPFRSIIKFIRENDRKEDIAFIEDAIVMGRPSFMDVGMLLVKKDGSEVAVGDSAAPLAGSNGEAKGAIIVFRDASKERETMHMRSEFVYASHQLRTPITEALWNLDVAKKEEDQAKRTEDLDIVGQSLASIQKLSEHLVSASEIDQGSVAVKKTTVKIVDVLGELQSVFEKEANRKNITLSFGPVSVAAAFDTDQKLFKKVLYEVVENAIFYSPEGSEVKVNIVVKDNDLIVEVIDTGVGIPEAEQPVMFTKFFRASNRPKKVAGSGLGLYIAREYVKVLGGKIWFESEEGKGTTFFVSLPLV